MMDVSDGLAKDLGRLAAASGVGARVRLGDVPVAAGATLEDALGGGEDYELLVTLPGAQILEAAAAELREAFGTRLTAVGEVVAGDGVAAIEPGGAERPLGSAGWDHFGP
jgi:thiamine-monophosphate kinase